MPSKRQPEINLLPVLLAVPAALLVAMSVYWLWRDVRFFFEPPPFVASDVAKDFDEPIREGARIGEAIGRALRGRLVMFDLLAMVGGISGMLICHLWPRRAREAPMPDT